MPYKLSKDKRNDVKSLALNGESTRSIVKRTSISKATVNRIKIEVDPNYSRPSAGRPRVLHSVAKQLVRLKLRRGYLETAQDVCRYLNSIGYVIGYYTTRKVLKELGFKCRRKVKTAALEEDHVKNRLKWAKEHRHWTVEDWKKVIFSDETKVNTSGSDGVQYTYVYKDDRLKPFNFAPKKKFGGRSIMVWGCMTSLGVGYACRLIEKTMDSNLYRHILNTTYNDTLRYYGWTNKDVIFQQDGNTSHTSKTTLQWIEKHKINLLKNWLANSPDLNPIEHLWHQIKVRLNRYPFKPQNVDILWERFDKEWNKFTRNDIERYYESMPKRIEEVIKAKGGYIKH
jgi:transposase